MPVSGSRWLKDERIAEVVAGALWQGAEKYRLYDLLAWVIMPNHVHIVSQLMWICPGLRDGSRAPQRELRI